MQDLSRTNQALIEENSVLKQKIKELERSEAKHRHVEGDLNAREEIYRNIFLNAQTGIWRTDINTGLILDANDCVARFLGYKSREEILREPFSIAERYVDPADRERIISLLKEHGQFNHFEAQFRCNDGSIIWMRYSGKLLPDKGWIEGVSEDITKEKAAYEAQRESEERYRAISEYSHNAICIIDEQAKIIWGNEKMQALGGYSHEQLYGAESFIGFLAPESLEFVVSNFQKVIAGEPYEHHYTFYLIHADGEKRLCEKYMTDFKDKQGKRNLIISMLDITERKRAEDDLRASKEHFEQLFNMCPYGIALSRVSDGLLFDVNDAWLKILGFARDEIIGKSPLELNLYENPADRQKLITELKEKGFFDTVEVSTRTKDGMRIIAGLSARLIEQRGNSNIISTVIDITEQKRVYQEIQEEKMRFEALFSASPQATVLTRLSDGLIMDFNEGFTDITGYARDEAIGKTSIALNIYPNPVDRQNIVNEIKQKGICRNYEAVFRMKNGGTMIGSMSAKVINFNDVAHIISVTSDVTELKKAEDELKRRARDLEEANTALRVFMNCHDQDQKLLQENLQININDLVIPYLKKLREAKLDDYHANCLELLETNLGNIFSPFIANVLEGNKQMTPQEIQIMDLIRKGLSTKEIAEMMHSSVHTVATHRNNIRKKLALRNSKTNLRSYLLSLQ